MASLTHKFGREDGDCFSGHVGAFPNTSMLNLILLVLAASGVLWCICRYITYGWCNAINRIFMSFLMGESAWAIIADGHLPGKQLGTCSGSTCWTREGGGRGGLWD